MTRYFTDNGQWEFGLAYKTNKPSVIFRKKNKKIITVLTADTFSELSTKFVDYYQTYKNDKSNIISTMPYNVYNRAKGDLKRTKDVKMESNLKLKNILKEETDSIAGVASTLLLFDKLRKTPAFITAVNSLQGPADKYTAILKFAELVGVSESKFDSFITNMKNTTVDE